MKKDNTPLNNIKVCFICKKKTLGELRTYHDMDYLAVPDDWIQVSVCGLWKNFCEDCIPIYNKEMN